MRRPLARTLLLSAPGWARNELWRRARAVPSLDLRFADSKSLVDSVSGQQLITFTRASDGTFVNSQGVLTTASSNVPRFDHNPTTGESLGLLIEEQRTNSIRNNTMVGAVAGTPGTLPTNWSVSSTASGLTSSVVGVGVENGISYIDIQVGGTTTSSGSFFINFDVATATAASSGQAWTCSAYLAVVGGSFANMSSANIRVIERGASGSFITETTTSLLGLTNTQLSPAIRSAATRSSMGGTTQFASGALSLGISSAHLTIDITLRIGMPQLEQGAFATSVIPTTGTAATRSADVASITGSAFSGFYRQSEGTFFADAIPNSGGGVFGVDDTTNAERWRVGHNGTTTGLAVVVDGNSIQWNQTTALNSWVLGTRRRIALAVQANNSSLAIEGAALTSTSSMTMPTVTQATIGNAQASVSINGHIRRLTYWPQRLGNEVLQRITL